MERNNNSFTKLVQYKFYSLLSNRFGMAVMIIAIFITLNSLFQFITIMGISKGMNYDQQQDENLITDSRLIEKIDFQNNIVGKDLESLLCSQPIDVVYTWVNGSDPLLIREVNALKKSLRDPNMPECKEKQSPNKDNCFRDDNPVNRYVDNQELKYSLRSLEKFAPWIRHVYIVTNGQVPNWIDLSNPKVSIVSHKDIFSNKTHLPTFSSPSIESHIHKIPGLSKKFLYLNDDVMFGRPIYPDDFYTQNGGQKVFLSWPVPNCNDGCPNNWIGDGFCDLACNVTTCDFDGNDCNNSTGQMKTRWWSRGNSFQPGGGGGATSTNTNGGTFNNDKQKIYCSRGCPESWVGDKHCDRMCKNADCGFDAGDCGTEIMFKEMTGYNITTDTDIINLPDLTPSVYFNLTTLIQNASITDGSHDNSVIVRTATISQKYKIMTLVFHKNITKQNVAISITFEDSNKKSTEKSFNVTISTEIKSLNSSSSENSNELINNNNSTTITTTTTSEISTSSSTVNENNNLTPIIENSNSNNNNNINSNNIESSSSPPKIKNEEIKNEEINLNNTVITALNDDKLNSNDNDDGGKGDQHQNIPNEILTEKENIVNDDGPGQFIQDNKDTGGFTIRSIKSIDFDLYDIEIEQDSENSDSQEESSGDFYIDQKLYIYKKQKELEEYNQLDNEFSQEKKYRINRETERELREEAGEIYPWEMLDVETDQDNGMKRMSRKPLDVFGDSLKFVNRLYSIEFGSQTRKVPAHMPHMIDVDVMNEMQEKWPKQWDDTSSHRLRSPRDMQYAFSFFYYLIHKKVPFDIDSLWSKELDVNEDGVLDLNELRSFAVVVYGVPLKAQAWKDLKSSLYQSCMEIRIAKIRESNSSIEIGLSKFNYAETKESQRVQCAINLEVLKNSNKTMEDAKKAYSKRAQWRTSMEGTDEVAFLMISNNDTVAESKLDGIRQKRHKFICLNDNMDHSNDTDLAAIKVVHDFYQSLFPFPSSFELPLGQQNSFTYIDQIIETKKEVKSRNHSSYYIIVIISIFLILLLWRCKISTSFHNPKQRKSIKKSFQQKKSSLV